MANNSASEGGADIPQRSHGGCDEWPMDQRCEDNALRIEASAQDIEAAKPENQHADQMQESDEVTVFPSQ